MKNSLLILAVTVIAFASCKKQDDVSPSENLEVPALQRHGADDGTIKQGEDRTISVPEKVKAAFKKYFPGATVREWRLTSKGLYKAHFTRNGADWEASFTAKGTLVKTERD
jgi:hypothetical protein